MQQPSDIRKIAFLGDYLPRKCGIATFTTDLRCAVAAEFPAMQCLVVPVNDIAGGYDYPAEVRFEIAEQDLPSYLRAADFLNITDVDVMCVEHEFGIFRRAGGQSLCWRCCANCRCPSSPRCTRCCASPARSSGA